MGNGTIGAYYFSVEPRKAKFTNGVKDDIEISEAHVIVDFHQRKKHGDTVPPIENCPKVL